MPTRWLVSLLLVSTAVSVTVACAPPAPPENPRPEGRVALVKLGAHYADLRAGAEAILSYTDTAGGDSRETLQVVAGHLAGELGALQHDFEETTAALRTDQLNAILPLWERMAMAQAGLSMLQQEAVQLREDPAAEADELQAVAEQLEAVLELAIAGQQGALENLNPPAKLVYSQS